MTPLRRRMIDDMQLRGLSARTQEVFVAAVRQLAGHYHRSPEGVTEEELRRYFLYLANEKRVARATATIALCGIRFLYHRQHAIRHGPDPEARPHPLSALQGRASRRDRGDPTPRACQRETAVTRVTVLVSSVHCGSRPYGCYAFVLPPRHIDLLGDTAKLRDSVAQRVHSRFDRQIVYDTRACTMPMPLI